MYAPSLEAPNNKPRSDTMKVQARKPVSLLGLLTLHSFEELLTGKNPGKSPLSMDKEYFIAI